MAVLHAPHVAGECLATGLALAIAGRRRAVSGVALQRPQLRLQIGPGQGEEICPRKPRACLN
jgi:hypothetical protein